MNRRWIAACHSVPHAGGDTVAAALKDAVLAVDGSGLPCFSAVSARDISFHSLIMPFRSIAKIRQVIAFELEPRLLTPLEEVQFDLCQVRRDSDQSAILAAVVSRSSLDHFLGKLRDSHLDLVAVDVRNHALAVQVASRGGGHETILILDFEDGVLSLCHQGVVLLHRCLRQGMHAAKLPLLPEQAVAGRGQAFLLGIKSTLHAYGVESGLDLRPTRIVVSGFGSGSKEKEMVDLVSGHFSCPAEVLDLAAELSIGCRPEALTRWRPGMMNTALALALRGVKGKNSFNFLIGDYLRTRSTTPYAREFRKGIFWLSLIMALLALQQGLAYRDLKYRYHELDQQTRQIFHRVFPSAQLKVDPLLQMRATMKELQQNKGSGVGVGGGTVLDLLTEISARTSQTWKVRFVSLVVDADAIQIKGVTDNFNTVDALKQELAGSPKVKGVTISSAVLDRQNSVAFELRMHKAL